MRASRGSIAALATSAAAVTAAVAASSPAAAPPDELRILAKPGLVPRFDPAAPDYVSRCEKSKPLALSIQVPKGGTVSVDGAPARSGTFTAKVGLKSDQAVVVRASSAAGASDYHVRCLPPDFPSWTAKRTGPAQAEWYLVTPTGHFAAFFDSRGVPVWWKRTADEPFNPTLLLKGNLAWYPHRFGDRVGASAERTYEERRLDGSLVRKLGTVGSPTDLHEVQQLANNHYLLDTYRPRSGVDLRQYGGPANARIYDAVAQEVTRKGGLAWSWSSRGRIALSETGHRWWRAIVEGQKQYSKSKRVYDPVHINSIAKDGDGFVISMRHTDAIYRVDRVSGRIEWKLGGTHTPESLSIVGDPEGPGKPLGGQHDARVLPDGTITVFDNGTDRGRPPRVLRYAIDTVKDTATVLEQVTDPAVRQSSWGGGTRKLPGGNWVTAWGGEPYVTEMTPAGKSVLRLFFPKRNSYRVDPIVPGRLTAAALRAAMDRMHPR